MAKKAWIYPGQGAQSVGMGIVAAESFPEAGDLFKQASGLAGYDMLEFCASGPMEKLSRTLYTQPALFTVEAALTEVLKKHGLVPDAAAGHSLGEFCAWYAAGVYDFETGFSLVSARGRLMDGADPEGRGNMAAVIGLTCEVVREVCRLVTGNVVVANINSPLQMVISGEKDAVEEAGVLLRERGAKRVIPLPVSGAFHSPLMEKAREEFNAVVDGIRITDARIPVYANVTAKPVTDAGEIRRLMVLQLTSPVRWAETVQNMVCDGITEALELGPGNVLAGLIKRTVEEIEVKPVSEPADIWEVLHEEA
ncbi:MAG: ACP S-malonyltransferase [Candidatus Latescibacter sp.]|nr:ACP S-malonyltransferase [Candidatus Latescibacter sp.]